MRRPLAKALAGGVQTTATLDLVRRGLIAVPAVALALGLAARATGRPELAQWIWGAATAVVVADLAVEIGASLRRAEVGLDIVALLSMSGALLLGEQLAGVVVALMYA